MLSNWLLSYMHIRKIKNKTLAFFVCHAKAVVLRPCGTPSCATPPQVPGDVQASPRPPQARGCGWTVPGTLRLQGSGSGLKHPGSGAPQPVWKCNLSSKCWRESGAHAEGARCASAVGPQESFSIPEDVPSFPAAFDRIVLQDLRCIPRDLG